MNCTICGKQHDSSGCPQDNINQVSNGPQIQCSCGGPCNYLVIQMIGFGCSFKGLCEFQRPLLKNYTVRDLGTIDFSDDGLGD